MVLSTQALLVAVGVGTQSAAPMAAALNWVMKDGVGQLGGVVFASQLGKGGVDVDYWKVKLNKLMGSSSSKSTETSARGNFQRGTADSNPKRWRMVAALALDLSTLLEICTPWMGPQWFLPCASIANIGKNVGFLAASASRAAVHQSLCTGGSFLPPVPDNTTEKDESYDNPKKGKNVTSSSNNLGDVTAKSGSQAIVASLLGTALGILLSRTFCSDYGTAGILAGFVILSAVHQVCTYRALKAVPLRSLDRHRLHIILNAYITADGRSVQSMVLTPSQVAEEESFLPMMAPDNSVHWLSVGDSLIDICPSGLDELEALLIRRDDISQYEKYIMKVHLADTNATKAAVDGIVQLTFLDGATDNDLLQGMFHAYIARALMISHQYHDGSNDNHNHGNRGNQIIEDSHTITNHRMPEFLEHLQQGGWQMGSGYVNVECGSSHRFRIQSV